MKKLLMLILMALSITSLPALANPRLVTSLPAKDSTVNISPAKLLLMFTDAVELTSLTLRKAGDRTPVKVTALPELPSRPLVVPLPKLAAGVYTVTYWITNADLRETRGSFEFTVDSAPEWPRARRSAEVAKDIRK